MTNQTTPNTNQLNQLINDHLSNLPKSGDIVKAQVIRASKKEILVDIDGFTTGIVRGRETKHLPLEFIDLKPGSEIEAMVIDTENENGQMELSLQSALVETAWRFISEKEKNQEVIDVRITGANKGGLLAPVKGLTAFLPVSQLIPDHYPHVEGGDKKKILKKLRNFIGQTLSVKIITALMDEEKVIISEKRAWEELQKEKVKEYKIGDIVDSTIKSTTHFGAFVKFGDNLEALIHISQIPKSDDKDPGDGIMGLTPGDEYKAKIIDIKGTKVFLSLRGVAEVVSAKPKTPAKPKPEESDPEETTPAETTTNE